MRTILDRLLWLVLDCWFLCLLFTCNICSNILHSEDPISYTEFCNSTVVVPNNTAELNVAETSSDLGVSMKDMLYGFIADCVRKNPGGYQFKNQNILALGYRCKVRLS